MNAKPLHRRLDEIAIDDHGARAMLRSLSDKHGEKYSLAFSTDGTYYCSCPDHTYRRHLCKHLQRFAALLQKKVKR